MVKKTTTQLDREISEVLGENLPGKQRAQARPAKSLHQKRADKAQEHFEAADLPEVAAIGEWTEDGDVWSLLVFWEGQHKSKRGSYGVEFAPGSTKIIESWSA